MGKHRSLSWVVWIPTLLLCAVLTVGLATLGDPSPTTNAGASSAADAAGHAAPQLAASGTQPIAAASGAAPGAAPGANGGSEDALEEDAADGAPKGAAPADAEDAQDDTSDDASNDSSNDSMRDGAPLTASHPLVARVIKIQNRHTLELMKHPGVVGTATGMNERGEISVIVLAKRAITDLPASLEGVPVVVHVTGELFASKGKPGGGGGGGKGGGKGGGTSVDPTVRFERPVPIGISTGHPAITAGTIGCRVKAGAKVWALSNNHVYADENMATIDDAVIQPGTYDGGTSPADDIGTLDDFVPITFVSVQDGGANTMDAAIALSSTADLGRSTPSDGYGLPRSTIIDAAINMRVSKYGRTTGKTNGKVYAINAAVNVGYSMGTAGYLGQIIITPGSFSAGGDSGSLIVVQKGGDARKPVGLLFAGSTTDTIACPIGPILSRFAVTVDGD